MKSTGTWDDFFEEKKDAPPRQYLVDAIKHVDQRTVALDLGAGTLRDSKFLLEQGFEKVIAIDADPLFLECAKKVTHRHLETHLTTFEEFEFVPNTYDIINAQYALPFADPKTFPELFERIVAALKTKEIFVVTFFGIRDSWNREGGKASVFHTEEEIQMLLKNFELLNWLEKEKDGWAGTEQKHFHTFHITARKK